MHRLIRLCNSTSIVNTFFCCYSTEKPSCWGSVLCLEQNKKCLPQRDSSLFLVSPACLKSPARVFQILYGSHSCSQEEGLVAEGRMGSVWAAASNTKGRMGLLYLMCCERRRWFGTCREGDNNLTVAKACEN